MRYAVYFTPPVDDPLQRLASRWLGRDAFAGEAIEQPEIPGMSRDRQFELTADPRRYGFHATLKAPFTLTEGRTEDELIEALQTFCQEAAAFEIPKTVVGQIGPFFALVPADHCQPLQDFSAKVVETFEPFRAALLPEDIARRKPEKLSQAQRNNLDRWGYPYVFDEFRFHMTLTGSVPDDASSVMAEALDRYFAGYQNQPLRISGLALFREEARGTPFHVQNWLPLTGA